MTQVDPERSSANGSYLVMKLLSIYKPSEHPVRARLRTLMVCLTPLLLVVLRLRTPRDARALRFKRWMADTSRLALRPLVIIVPSIGLALGHSKVAGTRRP